MDILTNQTSKITQYKESIDLTDFLNVAKIIIPAFTWIIVILTLVYFSAISGGLFLNEILLSSFIISCLFLFKLLSSQLSFK